MNHLQDIRDAFEVFRKTNIGHLSGKELTAFAKLDAVIGAAQTMTDINDRAEAQPIPRMQAEGRLAEMPKDGSPFLAEVQDWYHKETRLQLLKLSINGDYWDTAYTGDQTFNREDILRCWRLDALTAPKAATSSGSQAKR